MNSLEEVKARIAKLDRWAVPPGYASYGNLPKDRGLAAVAMIREDDLLEALDDGKAMRDQRIAELEAELARLRGEAQDNA